MSDSELSVGVVQRHDGSLDYSNSLHMGKESTISNEIVDRLRGSIVVDYDREDKYRDLEKRMKQMKESGELSTWLANTLNGTKPTANITEADMENVKYITASPQIDVVKKQFGRDYTRGYFSMDLGSFSKVYKKLTDRNGASGCIIHSSSFNSDPALSVVGITLVPGIELSNDTLHEVLHTIDPYYGKRNPQDQVLEEFGTYYRDTYIPTIATMTTQHSKEDGTLGEPVVTHREMYKDMPRITFNLKNNYKERYAPAFETPGDYEKQVDKAASIIQGLEDHMTKPDINKAIFNAKSVYELEHLLAIVKREKGEGL